MARRLSSTRRSPSTRRRGGRRRARPARFLRALLMLAIACGLLYCVKAAVAKVSRPYVINYGESKEVARLQKEIGAARAENRRLKNEIRDIETQTGKEAEARKLGWVKKGETAIVVEQPQKTALETAQPIPNKSCWQRASDWLARLFHRRS